MTSTKRTAVSVGRACVAVAIGAGSLLAIAGPASAAPMAPTGTQWTAIATFPDKEGCEGQASTDRMSQGGEFVCISNAGPATHGEDSWTLYQKYYTP